MKIVCENCSAKYSIADEKVKGKVFKIRCKKCGESIVVRGDVPESAPVESAPQPEPQPQPAAQPMSSNMGAMEEEDEYDAQTKVFDYSGYRDDHEPEPEWHIVVDGDQQGPYTVDQIKEFLAAGSIDLETYIWKEGFEDWLPISEVPELASAQPAAAASPFSQPAAEAQAPAQRTSLFDEPAANTTGQGLFDQPTTGGLFGDSETGADSIDGGDGLFSTNAEAPTGEGDIFSSAPNTPAGGGLFSGAPEPEYDGGSLFSAPGTEADAGAGGDIFGDLGGGDSDDVLFSSAEPAGGDPRVSAEQAMMTGQRSENSVLFSLSNLQALAADSEPAASAGPLPKPGMATSGAGGGEEASGLIDIRSLAGSLTEDKGSEVDDLLSIGGSGGFGPALGAPVLAAAQPAGLSMGAKIGIAAGGAALIAVVVVVLVLFLGGKDEEAKAEHAAQIAALEEKIKQMALRGASASELEAANDELKSKKGEGTKDDSASAKSQSKRSAGDEATGSSGDEPSKSRGSSSRKGKSRSKSSSSGSSSAASSTSSGSSSSSSPKTSKPKSSSSGSSELDDLLGGATPKPKPKSKPKPKPAAGSDAGGSSSVKESLTRTDVQKGMNGVSGKVKGCGGGQSGTITIKAVIGGTGRVISAVAIGNFAGTPVGTCAARAVRQARFPKSKKNLTVRFPFKL